MQSKRASSHFDHLPFEYMDLIISVDTSVGHLAGALGVPTFLMLPFASDIRWMIGRSDCPWYPTMKLFRQPKPYDWKSVVANVKSAVEKAIINNAIE